MSNIWGNTIYSLLEQIGPFGTADTPPGFRVFSAESRQRTKGLREKTLITKYRATRNQIFEFLNVRSFSEITDLLKNSEQRHCVEKRAYLLLGNMFGIHGNEREVIYKVDSYSRTADAVIRYLNNNILANYAPFIEMTNEIDITSSPVELLLIMFDERYHKKARFEAKRKLLLLRQSRYNYQR